MLFLWIVLLLISPTFVLTVRFGYFHVMRYVGLIALGGLLAAACGGSEPAAKQPITTTTSSVAAAGTSTSTTAAPATTLATTTTVAPSTTVAKTEAEVEAEIIEAYLAGWDVFFQVVADPEADPSLAEEWLSGVPLESTLETRDGLLSRNALIKFPEESVAEHRPVFMGFEGDVAVVRDCFTDDGFELHIVGGEISNAEIVTGLWFSKLEQVSGNWKTTFTDRLLRWEGVVPTCEGPGSQSS